MNVCFSSQGILEQFDGFSKLKELEWDRYREKYGDIARLDRILKAENISPDEFQLAKQADTMMTFYNLNPEEIADILMELGHITNADLLRTNYYYYLPRTSHGSTLSRVVHSQLANTMGDYDLAWNLYMEALTSDFIDI
mmetsp:Transcript_21957/g.10329  ORF Transcript_21957/g.10329 Transcript_21957/m.10329 type:complete len:139 (+) Transcript_21957:391-807(+)|eukprot:CAMPEP_0201281220 /NCGR_PEP_ID=MMETSP1317-20130820/1979_1 /ASSEMBLY_ACC=CAM_ASM_000770 /TAXON_ID=187299 /ORGANISM="Undescribed Undescribed, Strain Undescribed" /LENGTH=138 /DNA_ID=CAMNT_0047590531 /DNA_START=2661 /DNA_END=3077 /DNA_ORIENTATION=-